MATEPNPDYDERVVVNADCLPYAPSRANGVWHKRLELEDDGERGGITTIVRFDPGARCMEHDDAGGEEILVLDGQLCDARGCFAAGTYQLNPAGFRHARHAPSGCLVFMKLGRYQGLSTLLIDSNSGTWIERGPAGVRSLSLSGSATSGGYTRLTQLAPGTKVPRVDLPDGEELFVVRGSFSDEHGHYERHTWLRLPPGSYHSPKTDAGCLLYVKSGVFRARSLGVR